MLQLGRGGIQGGEEERGETWGERIPAACSVRCESFITFVNKEPKCCGFLDCLTNVCKLSN